MAREEGITGFFSGAWPTVVRGLLINVGMFMTFDPVKKTLAPYLGGEKWQIQQQHKNRGKSLLLHMRGKRCEKFFRRHNWCYKSQSERFSKLSVEKRNI